MIFCRYCGEKNREGDLHCVNCGKPLSLLPNDHQKKSTSSNSSINNKLFKKESKENGFKKPIKKYHKDDSFLKDDVENIRKNKDNKSVRSKHFHSDNEVYKPAEFKCTYSDKEIYKPTELKRAYSNNEVYKSQKNTKSSEWDVIVATALLVIILSAIFKRIFPNIGLFFALLIGLIYILIATKSKSTLIKAIPLAIMMIFAISAFFVI